MGCQVDFLETRDLFLERELSTTGAYSVGNARVGNNHDGVATLYGQAITFIETNRMHWFEIVTQYRVLFAGKGAHNCDTLLVAWVTRRVNKYVHTESWLS
jgi:hypothetical protein